MTSPILTPLRPPARVSQSQPMARLRATNGARSRKLWLDCDPGHDDAIAIVLAGYHPTSQLLGVSTVFGNQELQKVTLNAAMVLHYCGLKDLQVFPGQSRPLMRPPKTAEHIHGDSGLDRMSENGRAVSAAMEDEVVAQSMISSTKAVLAMRDAVMASLEEDPESSVSIVATAALTNVALFVTLFPELISHIKVVCMGGCMGKGNTGPVTEFNFQIDPEAAKIVFDSGVHLTMIPLEITNLARATEEIRARLCTHGTRSDFRMFIDQILTFFTKTYKEVYNFDDPPVHDPCAVLCALHPELFQLDHMRVDIETCSSLCAGQSVCDIWHQSPLPANCFVGRKMDLDRFWAIVIDAVEAADRCSPLNKSKADAASRRNRLVLGM